MTEATRQVVAEEREAFKEVACMDGEKIMLDAGGALHLEKSETRYFHGGRWHTMEDSRELDAAGIPWAAVNHPRKRLRVSRRPITRSEAAAWVVDNMVPSFFRSELRAGLAVVADCEAPRLVVLNA